MTIFLVLVGIFNVKEMDMSAIIMIGLYLFANGQSTSPMAWLYAIETTIDTALGICLMTLWGTTFVLSLVCPVLMGQDYLGESNTFYLFALLTFLGSLYG